MKESFMGALNIVQLLSAVLVFVLGIGLLAVAVMYIIDKTQTSSAIRRNFPVIGRFRYFFENLGEYFRQYFFAQDREEMPFNRAQRSWVYRAAKDIDNTIAFGSTRDLRPVGTMIFVNCPYPVLETDMVPTSALTIGPYAKQPYTTDSIINVSAMSYGAISKPAVLALSKGSAMAGNWMNTGEGGLSPYHLEGGADIVFQMGTAKYGVRDKQGNLDDDKLREVAAHDQVKMIEIKLSQGAKPGKGGILPGAKVTEDIAKIRGIHVGEDSISPNRHPEIDSAEDLLDMIHHIREVTGSRSALKPLLEPTDGSTSYSQSSPNVASKALPTSLPLTAAMAAPALLQ